MSLETKRALRRRVEDLRAACNKRENEVAALLLDKRELKSQLREAQTAASREQAIREILLEKKEVALREATKARLELQEENRALRDEAARIGQDREALRAGAGELMRIMDRISAELLKMSETLDEYPTEGVEKKLAELSHELQPGMDFTDEEHLLAAGYYDRRENDG